MCWVSVHGGCDVEGVEAGAEVGAIHRLDDFEGVFPGAGVRAPG